MGAAWERHAMCVSALIPLWACMTYGELYFLHLHMLRRVWADTAAGDEFCLLIYDPRIRL